MSSTPLFVTPTPQTTSVHHSPTMKLSIVVLTVACLMVGAQLAAAADGDVYDCDLRQSIW